MTEIEFQHRFENLLSAYISTVRAELDARWNSWKKDLAVIEMHEVIGALMARQVSLACQMARSPQIWNEHIAPMIFRTMADTQITLAWILKDPVERSRRFIHHGLGQIKLLVEHFKAKLMADGINPENDARVKDTENWINGQRFTFLTEVNVGNWAGIDTRKMADEAGLMDIYNFNYSPYSSATHSMWPHIAKFNLQRCSNPLHRHHGIPSDPDLELDPHLFRRAAEFVAHTFALFDQHTSTPAPKPSAYESLLDGFAGFAKDPPSSKDETSA